MPCGAPTRTAHRPAMPAYLDVVAEAPMGQLVDFVLGPGQAALVHTGGMVPAGADAVVMIEQTHRAGGPMFGGQALQPGFEPYAIEVYRPWRAATAASTRARTSGPARWCWRRPAAAAAGHRRAAGGGDHRGAGRAAAHGWASSARGTRWCRPKQEPGPGQVRDINSYTLAGFVREAGGIPLNYPIAPDTEAGLDAVVRQAYRDADIVVITAGSSVSYRDLTADAINKLGAPGVLVHGVAIRPGKPTILALCDGKPVFGLPGNPVSCINIFKVFVIPTIRLLLGAAAAARSTVRTPGSRATSLRPAAAPTSCACGSRSGTARRGPCRSSASPT